MSPERAPERSLGRSLGAASQPASAARSPRQPAPQPTVEQLAQRLRDTPARAGVTRVIAVDGRSGAGKSTLARSLAAALGGAPLVTLEDLYGGWDGLQRGIDLLLSDVLEPLSARRPAEVPRYDWHAARWEQPWLLGTPPLLVVEGVGAGANRVAPYLSMLVWLELDEHERRRRAFARDGEGYRPHWDGWAAQERELLARERTRERADVVLDAVAPLS